MLLSVDIKYQKARFSHIFDDDISKTIFLYFKGGHIQDLNGKEDLQLNDEFCIHLDYKDKEKLIEEVKKLCSYQ